MNNLDRAKVINFPKPSKKKRKTRKSGINKNKVGSTMKKNGKVWFDFPYLDERVRVSSGLTWNQENIKQVREQLDIISSAIKNGVFRFSDTFPDSRMKDHFLKKERNSFNLKLTPDQINCGEYFDKHDRINIYKIFE